jgi:hypothetical protein
MQIKEKAVCTDGFQLAVQHSATFLLNIQVKVEDSQLTGMTSDLILDLELDAALYSKTSYT